MFYPKYIEILQKYFINHIRQNYDIQFNGKQLVY